METTQRQSYLDWLRIISIAGVLIIHSGMPYAANLWWHVKDHQSSTLLFLSNVGMHLVRMPLLFFISGTVSYYMMQRRSAWSFIGLRFTRLFIPLLVGILVVVPPQIYIERITQGFKGSFWDFYPTIFTRGMYPKGNFSWHHLWFIAYLFIYDLVFAPAFMWLVSEKSNRFKSAVNKLGSGKLVFLLAVPSILWFTILCNPFDEMQDLIHDGAYFVYWLLFVLVGFLCILVPSLMDSLQRNRRFALSIGFASMLVIYYFLLNNSINIVAIALRPVTAWAWVFGLIGYGKAYLNRPHKSLNYLNQAVYPFYIIHQTVIVILAFYITRYGNDTVLMKYIYTVGVTLFITMGIFHFFIKPYAITRFLFGVKTNAAKPKPNESKLATSGKRLTEMAV